MAKECSFKPNRTHLPSLIQATYYIYTIASTKLEKLSDGDKQQVPTWSPDGNLVAFVRNNNIFLVKLLYDNAESSCNNRRKAKRNH